LAETGADLLTDGELDEDSEARGEPVTAKLSVIELDGRAEPVTAKLLVIELDTLAEPDPAKLALIELEAKAVIDGPIGLIDTLYVV
jgi:hypothetical protein